MHPKLKASLYEAIAKWVEENCENNEWPEMVVGRKTEEFMADAAAAVLDACAESQAYSKDQGYVKEAKV